MSAYNGLLIRINDKMTRFLRHSHTKLSLSYLLFSFGLPINNGNEFPTLAVEYYNWKCVLELFIAVNTY